MSWIKRNLYFVIGGLVALGLMGYGGFGLWSAISSEGESAGQIVEKFGELDTLKKQNPHPGSAGQGKVDNVKAAQEQEAKFRAYITKIRSLFVPPAPIPEGSKIDDEKFSNQLGITLAELNRQAKEASVTLPDNYAFTFQSQKFLTQFDPGSVDHLAMHLGEIKAICDILFAAKINQLEGIQREIVSAKDQNSPDYLTTQKTMTTPLGDLTPYRVVFRCFSAELADVLSGLASSRHGFIVKTINVEAAPAAPPSEMPVVGQPTPQAVVMQPIPGESRTRMMNRMNRYTMPPPVAPGTVAARPTSTKPTVLLNEHQLKVSLLIEVVKLKAEEVKPKAEASKGRSAGPKSRTPQQ